MKNNPNYENTVGKHPIPHAKGIAKGENRNIKNPKKGVPDTKATKEEE
jgi:hypothetical protein